MKNKMTREEVIKGLSVCSNDSGSCDGCPFYGEVAACDTELLKDALQLLEQDRESKIATVVDKYRIYNKDNLMDGFFDFVRSETEWRIDCGSSDAEFIIGRIHGAITFLERIMSGGESLVRKEKADANKRL